MLVLFIIRQLFSRLLVNVAISVFILAYNNRFAIYLLAVEFIYHIICDRVGHYCDQSVKFNIMRSSLFQRHNRDIV